MNLRRILPKAIRKLYRRYLKYEKYFIWLVFSNIFCSSTLWLAKRIYDIHVPGANWKNFLEVIGVLSFLVAVFSAYLGWSGERKQEIKIQTARKEEQVVAALDKLEHMLLRVESKTVLNAEAIASINEDISDLQSGLGRLAAQVQQIESEAILKRRLTAAEGRLQRLEQFNKD